jgi:hypothetical protein
MPKHAKTNAAKTTSFVKRANGSPPEGEQKFPTVRETLEFIAANPDREPLAAGVPEVEKSARAMMSAAMRSGNEQEFYSRMAPYHQANIQFDPTFNQRTGSLLEGRVRPFVSPNLAEIFYPGEQGETVPHELEHVLQNRAYKFKDEQGPSALRQDLKSMYELEKKLVGRADKLQDDPDIPYRLRGVFSRYAKNPESPWREDLEEIYAYIGEKAFLDSTKGIDFLNTEVGKKLFPAPEDRALFYQRVMPGTPSAYPAELPLSPLPEGRDPKASYARQAMQFLKDKMGYANGGAASSAKSGVNRLKQSEAYPKMPRFQDGGDVSNDDWIQQTLTGTRPADQELGFIGQGIRAAGAQLYENLREAVQDPKAFHKRALGNIATRLQEDPEGFAMDWTGGGLGGIIRPKGGGNLLSGEVDRAIAPLRPTVTMPDNMGQSQKIPPSEVSASLKELITKNKAEGYPTEYAENLLKEVTPMAALDDWIKNKFGSYVKRQMGTEDDPIRKLADEMDAKIKDDYAAGLKRIAKMKDDIAKAKAKGKRTDVSERELADEIDRVEEAFQSASALPVQLGPYTHTSSSIGDARVKAGMSPYPVAQSRTGRAYEELADEPFVPTTKKELREDIKKSSLYDLEQSPRMELDPWLGKLKDEDLVYRIRDYDLNERHIFTHTIDELRNALNPNSGLPPQLQLKPDDMQALGIEKAFRHVNKINDWRAQQRIAANLEEAKRSAVTVKEYPDSPRQLKWQQLKPMEYTELPPGYSINSTFEGPALFGPDGARLTTFRADSPVSPQAEALQFVAKNDLEKALQYEGSTMRHCVGGYCDSVWTGETKIFSLRDRKGEPHVTIETAPADIRREGNTPRDFIFQNPEVGVKLGVWPKNESRWPEDVDTFLDDIANQRKVIATPEFQQWLGAKPQEILQIKGKGNGKPKDDYIPFIQDFVRSQQWSQIGDLPNADLVPLKAGMLDSLQKKGIDVDVFFYDASKHVDRYGSQPYVTKQEFNRLADLLGGMNKYD